MKNTECHNKLFVQEWLLVGVAAERPANDLEPKKCAGELGQEQLHVAHVVLETQMKVKIEMLLNSVHLTLLCVVELTQILFNELRGHLSFFIQTSIHRSQGTHSIMLGLEQLLLVKGER